MPCPNAVVMAAREAAAHGVNLPHQILILMVHGVIVAALVVTAHESTHEVVLVLHEGKLEHERVMQQKVQGCCRAEAFE